MSEIPNQLKNETALWTECVTCYPKIVVKIKVQILSVQFTKV